MRIAAIADVHGNVDALRTVLTHIERVSSPELIMIVNCWRARLREDLLTGLPQSNWMKFTYPGSAD